MLNYQRVTMYNYGYLLLLMVMKNYTEIYLVAD